MSKLDRRLIGVTAAVVACAHVNGFAQTANATVPNFSPPTVDMVDAVGVSMNSGRPNFTIAPVKIGPASDPLVFTQSFEGGYGYPTSGWFGWIEGSHFGSPYGIGDMIVHVPSGSEQLKPTGDGINYVSRTGRGGTLSISSSFVYQYIDRNGTVFDFDSGANPNYCADHDVWNAGHTSFYEQQGVGNCARLSRITYPTGLTVTIGQYFQPPGDTSRYIQKVTRSDGYQLIVDIASISGATGVATPPTNHINKITAFNMAFDYCDPAAAACTFSQTWPTANFAWTTGANNTSVYTVTDNAGNQTRYTEQFIQGLTLQPTTGVPNTYYLLTGLKPPSSATADTVTYSYSNQRFCYTYYSNGNQVQDCSTYVRDALVQTAVTPNGTWSYGYTHDSPGAQPPYSGLYTTTVTRPDQYKLTGQYNALTGYIQYVQGTSGSVTYDTTYTTDPNNILNSTDSEGRQYAYTYDGRGNLLTKQQNPSSSGPTVTANYPTTCSSNITCNKPTWIRDANANQTDYTYDPAHGGLLTETAPAVLVNGSASVRPQKRYTYVQRKPWLKNASGTYTAGSPIWKLNSISYCRTSAAGASGGCTAANDEVVTTFDYGPDSGPNNLLLRGQVVTADGVSHRTCYAYDVFGNKISETTPGAGLTSCP
jgi:YD repeat-containing protein